MRYRFLRFPEGKLKALTLSYDDGVKQDIKLSEILNKYGIKATFNINGNYIGINENKLTVENIKEYLLDKGHEVAVHGAQHIAPGNATAVDGINDVLECRKVLEREFGKIIRGMAYPDSGVTQIVGGASYEEIKQYLQMLGIVYSRTLGGDNNSFNMPSDWHNWMPTAHHNNPKLMEWLDEFINLKVNAYSARAIPKLFYLWGHSYEFDNNNNWDVIEKFCEKAAEANDVWFATNIEIYEYEQAYRSLIFNVDNTLVYNPTLLDVWFYVDGKIFCVKSGETLEIN